MTTKLPMYEVEYRCGNCNHLFKAKFLVGVEARKKITCSRCGVLAAEKSWTRPIVLPVVPRDDRWPTIPRVPVPASPPWKRNPNEYPPPPGRRYRRVDPYAGIGGGEGQRQGLC